MILAIRIIDQPPWKLKSVITRFMESIQENKASLTAFIIICIIMVFCYYRATFKRL